MDASVCVEDHQVLRSVHTDRCHRHHHVDNAFDHLNRFVLSTLRWQRRSRFVWMNHKLKVHPLWMIRSLSPLHWQAAPLIVYCQMFALCGNGNGAGRRNRTGTMRQGDGTGDHGFRFQILVQYEQFCTISSNPLFPAAGLDCFNN